MTTPTEQPATNPIEHAVESQIDDTPVAPAGEAAAAPGPAASAEDDVARNAGSQVGVDRAALGRKFADRRRKQEDEIPFEGSFTPAHARVGRLTQEIADEPAADAGDQQDDVDQTVQPRKHKLKVRGAENEVDDEEMIRLAQIGAAGESYLTEAKSKLDQVEERLRAASALQHPEAKKPANSPTDRADATTDPQHPEDDLSAIAEAIQYGDTEKATEGLRAIIERAKDPEATQKAVYMHQRTLDVGRAKTAFESFVAKPENAELLKDERNEIVLQKLYHDELRKDLAAIGVPADQIPADREALVETHRFHRVHGQRVRDTTALLDASKQEFVTWRGGPKKDPNPAPPSGGKVVVNLDRSARRAAIPQQPSRASAPQPQQAGREVPRTRSAAVNSILANRRRNIVT